MKIYRTISCVLSAAMLAAMPLALHAEMVSTSSMLAPDQSNVQVAQGLQTTPSASLLTRADVRNQLEALGVDSALAAERVAAMTDSQLQQLSLRMQELPAGSGALGIVITVLVIVLLLEILGITDMSDKV